MTVFLLSPAYCAGRRAKMLLREDSDMALARQLRAGELTLGAAFTFLSGLYFRGKMAYAQAFGTGPATFVITPTRGLQSPDTIVTPEILREFASVDISEDATTYRSAIERDVVEMKARLPARSLVVLLGSIATGKYVDVIGPVLGERLYYPASFVGRGDMSRGGLLLRSARAKTELDYVVVKTGERPRGARPAKLPKLPAREEVHRPVAKRRNARKARAKSSA